MVVFSRSDPFEPLVLLFKLFFLVFSCGAPCAPKFEARISFPGIFTWCPHCAPDVACRIVFKLVFPQCTPIVPLALLFISFPSVGTYRQVAPPLRVRSKGLNPPRPHQRRRHGPPPATEGHGERSGRGRCPAWTNEFSAIEWKIRRPPLAGVRRRVR